MALYLHTLVVLVYRCLISLIGIPGNLLILAVYWNKQSLGSAQVFIQALALSDLYVCMLLPLEIHFWLNEYTYTNLDLCKTYYTVASIGWFMSIFVTCAIALDRYIAVANPVNGRWTRQKAQQIALACVAIAVIINLAQPFASTIGIRQLKGVTNGTYCINKDSSNTVAYLVVTATQYVTCLIAFVFIFVIYFMLWRAVNKQRKKVGVKLVPHGRSIPDDSQSSEGTQIDAIEDSVSQAPLPAGHIVNSDGANLNKPNSESSSPVENRTEESGDQVASSTTGDGSTPAGNNVDQPTDEEEKVADDVKKGATPDKPRPEPVPKKYQRRRPPMSRLTLMLLLTTVIFFITWGITLVVFGLSSVARRLPGDSLLYALSVLFRYVNLVNNAINPFLYSLLNPRFRTDCGLLYKRLKSRLSN